MKVVGTVKSLIPINAFVATIFLDEKGNLYEQEIVRNKIKRFLPIHIKKEVIIKTKKHIEVKKGNEAISCFLTEKNRLIIGTMNEIEEQLLGLLYDDTFDPIAKLLISSKLKLHGITNDLIEECNKVFESNKINCKINEDNYLTTRNKYPEVIDIKIILNNLKQCASLIQKFKFLAWKDFFAILNNRIMLNDFRIGFDEFFLLMNTNESKSRRYLKSILELILERIEEEELDVNTIRDNKYFYDSLLKNEIGQLKINRILSPTFRISHTENKVSVSIMFRGFHAENKLMEIKDTYKSDTENQDATGFLEKANIVKDKMNLIQSRDQ